MNKGDILLLGAHAFRIGSNIHPHDSVAITVERLDGRGFQYAIPREFAELAIRFMTEADHAMASMIDRIGAAQDPNAERERQIAERGGIAEEMADAYQGGTEPAGGVLDGPIGGEIDEGMRKILDIARPQPRQKTVPGAAKQDQPERPGPIGEPNLAPKPRLTEAGGK